MPETTFDVVFRVAKANGVEAQKPGQDDESFLYSILKALSTCPQEQWEAMGFSCPNSHVWYNTGVGANKDSLPIPFPSGFKPKILTKPPVIKVEPAGGKNSVAPEAVPSVSQGIIASTPRKEKEKRSKNAGILDAIRKAVILNQDWSAKRVHEYITKNGFPEASYALVAVNVGDIKRVIIAIRELGCWKDRDATEKKTA